MQNDLKNNDISNANTYYARNIKKVKEYQKSIKVKTSIYNHNYYMEHKYGNATTKNKKIKKKKYNLLKKRKPNKIIKDECENKNIIKREPTEEELNEKKFIIRIGE